MRDLKSLFTEFMADESGLTTVEYAIAGALVAAAVVGAFTSLGESVTGEINDISDTISGD